MGTRDIWFLHASTFLFFLGMAVASIVSLVFKPFGGFPGDRGLIYTNWVLERVLLISTRVPFILLASLLVAQLPRFLKEREELSGGWGC